MEPYSPETYLIISKDFFFSLALDFPLSFSHPPTAIDRYLSESWTGAKRGTSNQIFKANLENTNYSVQWVRYYWRPFKMLKNLQETEGRRSCPASGDATDWRIFTACHFGLRNDYGTMVWNFDFASVTHQLF